MDNLCHTLTGAAIGQAGLNRKTRLASATLMISANLPDLDVLIFATEASSIAFRRGWTHGILAQLLLPVGLTILMVAIGRWRRPAPGGPPLDAAWLLGLSFIGIGSHVFLDFLNNYGIRLLAPFDWRWFYGDSVFIIDPWLWLALGLGVWASRRWRSGTPARLAVGLSAAYIVGMMISTHVARDMVVDAWRAERASEPWAVMVGPVAFTPARRQVIVDAGRHYEIGEFSWLPEPGLRWNPATIPKNDDRPEVRAARQTPAVSAFLVWSRFPFYELRDTAGGTEVSVADVRFATPNPLRRILRGPPGFSATTVVPRAGD